jgi:cysteine-rich repeat protein
LLLAVAALSTTAIANAPENDCLTAIPVAINSSSPVLFPCADKTPTGTDGSCVGFGLPQYAGTFDVWVSFVATQTAHRVRTDIGSAGSDTNYGVFSGGCGAPVEVGCSEDEAAPFLGNICVSGLTIGDTYLVQLGAFCDGCFGACAPDGYVVTVQGSTCGDGILECGEECDDSNTLSGDCCSSTCQNEFVCGDGVICGTEECDPPGPTCSSTCESLEICGDNLINVAGEECDGSALPQCPAGSYCATNCTCVVGIPAVSEWGLAVLTLIGLVSGTILFGRRRVAAH